MRRPASAALLLLAACSSTPASDGYTQRVVSSIERAEDERVSDPLIVDAALSNDPVLQRRAAVALGRIMDPDGAPFLVTMYGLSRDPGVRRAALFAMGQLGLGSRPLSPKDLEIMLMAAQDAMADRDATIRAAGVEAMGKLGLDKAPVRAMSLLKDESALVRRQAASACFRWRQVLRWRDPTAKPPDLPKEALEALSAAAGDGDAEVRWRAVHALLRSGSVPPAAVVNRYLRDVEPLCRVFALNLIERNKYPELVDAAAKAQSDPEPQARQAALRALDALDKPDLLNEGLVADPSHHVRQAVADLIAAEGKALDELSRDSSPAVRSAALLARVRILEKNALPVLESAVKDPEPVIRVAAARGAGELKDAGLPLLQKLLEDSSELVRAAAYTALADIEGPVAWQLIQSGLSAPKRGERSGAIEALTKRKEPGVLENALSAFRAAKGRDWVEIREVLVDFVAGLPPEATTPFLLEVARDDEAISVRQKAVAALKKRNVPDIPPVGSAGLTRTPYFGQAVPKNPVVYLVTTKGTVEITCFAEDAPVHVANFVGLVNKGFYDGLTWHRVVPNFVVQGGDPEGNGMGDAGYSLRAEINPIPYERGTLGMPRSAGFDTGGCQLFITHLPTPHLDGYYTVFGKVTRGMDVVDRIEVGDRIVEASVVP